MTWEVDTNHAKIFIYRVFEGKMFFFFFNLAFTERNMHVKFHLTLSGYSLGLDIWPLSLEFNFGLIGMHASTASKICLKLPLHQFKKKLAGKSIDNSIQIRRPVPSTDQALPSCFYFRISWILIERPWKHFFGSCGFLQGLRS